MPQVSITRSRSRILSRLECQRTQCVHLYDAAMRDHATTDVKVLLTTGYENESGTWVNGPTRKLPNPSSEYVSDYLPEECELAKITVEFTHGRTGFDPEEKLTRREFVMEVSDVYLQIIDALRANEQYSYPKAPTTVREEIVEVCRPTVNKMVFALEALKDVYGINELSMPGFGQQELEALLDTVKPIEKLKSGSCVFGSEHWDKEDGYLWGV